MTNQPTDNEWIEKTIDKIFVIAFKRGLWSYHESRIENKEEWEKAITEGLYSSLPKPTEVVAPVDENTSDGYHTFKELYEHRIALFIALMKCNPSISWRANNNDDGTNWEGRFVAGIHLNSGDISYHLPTDKRTELDGLGITTTLNAPKRDGYTAKDVVERLNNWKHLKGTTPVEPINQERLSELIEHIIGDFFDRHRLSYSTFDVDNEYSKRKADELVPALREICWEYLGKSLQSESEVVQGEKKDWKRDYIRKIPSSEYVDWLKDNMWRLPQGPFECDRCRTERERRERGVQR